MSTARALLLCVTLGAVALAPMRALAQADAGAPDAGAPAAPSEDDEDDGWTAEDEAAYEAEEAAYAAEEEATLDAEEEADEDETAEPSSEEELEAEEAAADEEAEEEEAAAPTRPVGAGVTITHAEPPPPHAEDDFDLTLPPIFHYHRHDRTTTTAVFPLFYLREDPTYSELVIPPVYHREGLEPFDVFFPLFWWFRGEAHHTWIAGPVWHHEDPTSHDFGLAPIVFSGRHEDRYYHVLPPLLSLAWGDADEDYLSAALLFYRFRVRESENWGLFPLLWVRNSPGEEYQFVPPLFFRWRNPETERTVTIVPPVYVHEDPGETFWGIAGLLHHDSGPGFHGTTIPPLLFHFSEEPGTWRLATPAFLYMNERGSETLVTLFYQRYRGLTELDMVLPLFLWARDPRDRSETLMASPLVWHWSDPGRDNWVVFPFFLHLDDRGRSTTWLTPLVGSHTDHEHHDETTWVFPTVQVSRWHDGDAVHVHPVFYYESVPSHRYAVFAPFWWDFEQFAGTDVVSGAAPVTPVDEGEAEASAAESGDDAESESDEDDGRDDGGARVASGEGPDPDGFGILVQRHTRYTVAFPFYYRIHEAETETQILLTTYFRRRDFPNEGRWEWEFHGSGLFDFGERSDGEHWWRVLYGLIGWEHRLDHDRLWLFYIPIDFGHAAATEGTPSATSTAALPFTETRN